MRNISEESLPDLPKIKKIFQKIKGPIGWIAFGGLILASILIGSLLYWVMTVWANLKMYYFNEEGYWDEEKLYHQ